MEYVGWYCPKCDCLTGNNVGKCGKCGEKAVHQRFQCWPIPKTDEDHYFDHLHAPRIFDKKIGELRMMTFAEYKKSIGVT